MGRGSVLHCEDKGLAKVQGSFQSMEMANKFFENMITFKYLGTTIRSQNYAQEENNSLVRFLESCLDILIEVEVEMLNVVPIIHV
jgi:hypothetical protein